MRFRIEYTDPETQSREVDYCSFEDTTFPRITALEWAEDRAYMLADKCQDYVITSVPD